MEFNPLKRREFVTFLGGAAVWPLAARAQSAVPVIGFLSSLSLHDASYVAAAFRQGVTETGFAEGQSVKYEYRYANGDYSLLATGRVARSPSPARRSTVLFTDIVGSTEKAVAVGDNRWRDLLDSHHATIRRNLKRFRGNEVKSTGDGILATFDGPARGVRCACSIAEEIRPLGINVRAGLHTGECEMIGDDVGGIAVHIGARVAALAGADEVLVSSTVKDLVAGSGLRFADRGNRSLKGIPGEWRIYAVEK